MAFLLINNFYGQYTPNYTALNDAFLWMSTKVPHTHLLSTSFFSLYRWQHLRHVPLPPLVTMRKTLHSLEAGTLLLYIIVYKLFMHSYCIHKLFMHYWCTANWTEWVPALITLGGMRLCTYLTVATLTLQWVPPTCCQMATIVADFKISLYTLHAGHWLLPCHTLGLLMHTHPHNVFYTCHTLRC